MSAARRDSTRWHRPNPEDLLRVLDVTRQMAAERDVVALLNLIIRRTTEVMRAERSSLFLIDRERNECWSRIAQGSEIAEIRFPVGVGIAGDVAKTGEPANIPDAYDDARFNPAFDRKTGFRTRSVLCLPLHDFEDEIVGVIQVLNKKDEAAFSDYDQYLLSALAAQAGVALSQARLLESWVEAQKLQQEMQLARQIQQSLLPAAPPELTRYDIAAHCESADETGGDYYDFLPQGGPDAPCAIAIGDVSGHGLGAALVMVQARAVLRSVFAGDNLGPAVAVLNDRFSQDLEDSRFMTFFMGLLEPSGRFRFTNAGHEPPLLIRPRASAEERVRELDSDGITLGWLEGGAYPEGEAQTLQSGDILFFCTDGLFEAAAPDDTMYGQRRMIKTLLQEADQSAARIVQVLVDDVKRFASGRALKDDLTIVVVKAR